MTVYIDVLLFFNAVINYLLLLAAAKIVGVPLKTGRHILASGVGALTSLYILAPPLGSVAEIAVRLIFAAAIVFSGFGFKSLKRFLRLIAVFFAVTFGFGGAMLALYTYVSPPGMVVSGGVVYFDISPPVLILTTAVAYGILLLIKRVTAKTAPAARRTGLTVSVPGVTVRLNAMIDTGHSLRDPFTGNPVVLIDAASAKSLFSTDTPSPETLPEALKTRFRLVPCSTAGGDGLLPAVRCDRVALDGCEPSCNITVAVAAGRTFGDDFSAVIGPELYNFCQNPVKGARCNE